MKILNLRKLLKQDPQGRLQDDMSCANCWGEEILTSRAVHTSHRQLQGHSVHELSSMLGGGFVGFESPLLLLVTSKFH